MNIIIDLSEVKNTEPRCCGDCGVKPGEFHIPGCNVEDCPRCGGQTITCSCIYAVYGIDPDTCDNDLSESLSKEMNEKWDKEWGSRRLKWTGVWNGEAECIEFGWYCIRNPVGPGYVPCPKDHPHARPDLNRLHEEAVWNPDQARYFKREPDVRSD